MPDREQLLILLTLILLGSPCSSTLPMTDYSQLNHDEPTHRTKPATTPTGQVSESLVEAGTTMPPSTDPTTKLTTDKTTDAVTTYVYSTKRGETASVTFSTPNPTSSEKPILMSKISQRPIIPSAERPILNSKRTDLPITHDYTEQPILIPRKKATVIEIEEPVLKPRHAYMTAAPYTSKTTDMAGQQNPQLEHSDITSEIASIEEKDSLALALESKALLSTTTTDSSSSPSILSTESSSPTNSSDVTVDGKNITDGDFNTVSSVTPTDADSNHNSTFYKYDIIEDIRNLFSNDPTENEIKESNPSEDVVGFKNDEKITTEETLIVQKLDEAGYENYQEEEERRNEEKKAYDALVVPTFGDREVPSNYETPFSDWDRESEEQEHNLENIVFQASNDSDVSNLELNRSNYDGGSWFLLLLTGNSTIVQMRQKDFAKYLKLNLAARLSLEYDQLRVNKVVLAPPRLMVNISVIPAENDNFDDEFDLNERLFGEGEAPLHKLAETNATLLELSGEEYHVVKFLSLRSPPVTMDESVSEASTLTSDKHGDIEYLVYIIVGGPCITVIIFLLYTLYRLYMLPRRIEWPWTREKPVPRHRRMEPPVGGPLTVIYSGSLVDRGSWLDEHYDRNDPPLPAAIENPNYGLGSLSKTALSDICHSRPLDSPRFNVRMMGCQPGHLLLPHTPVKKAVRAPITKGLDNPNYLS